MAVPCGPPSSWDSWPPSGARAARPHRLRLARPPSCSSPSTRCAPTASAATATPRRARRPSTPSPRAASVFERAYTPAPITLPAHTSMLTGLAAARARRARQRRLRARRRGRRPSRRRCARAGLRHRAPSSAASRWPGASGSARGFDHYDDAIGEGAGRAATSSPSAAADAWRTRRAPGSACHPGHVFVWVHLFDPHAPYDPPPAFRGAIPTAARVAAADAAARRRLLAAWDARPEPSIVVAHRRSRRGLRRARRGEPQPLRLRHDAARAARRARARAGRRAARRRRGGPRRHRGHHRATRVGPGGTDRCPAARCALRWTARPRRRSTRRRWPRASTSAGATCAPGATGDTSTSARRGRSSTTSRPIPARRATSPPRIPDVVAAADGGARRARSARRARRRAAARPTPRRRSGCARSATCRARRRRGSGADPKDKVDVALLHRARRRALPRPRRGRRRLPADRDARPRQSARELPARRRAAARGPRATRRSRTTARSSPAGRAPPTPFVGPRHRATRSAGRLDEARARAAARPWPSIPPAARPTTTSARSRGVQGDAAAARRDYEAALADPVTRERAQARLAGAAVSAAPCAPVVASRRLLPPASSRGRAPRSLAAARARAHGASVLLVTIDTLRADHVGAYGATTRGHAAHRRPGRARARCSRRRWPPCRSRCRRTRRSSAASSRRITACTTTARYVFPAGPRRRWPRVLKGRGYATGAFVAAYVLDRRFGLARGFDHYDDRIERRQQGASVLESERPAARWSRPPPRTGSGAQPGPFFAWVHFYDPHAPYDPPSPYREQQRGPSLRRRGGVRRRVRGARWWPRRASARAQSRSWSS